VATALRSAVSVARETVTVAAKKAETHRSA